MQIYVNEKFGVTYGGRELKAGQTYRHFKGRTYEILLTNVISADNPNDLMVIYENVNTKVRWVRKQSEFMSEVDREKYPDVKQKYRFELLAE